MLPDIDGLSLFILLDVMIVVPVCVHILLTKNESAALAWIALVVVSPFAGSALYWIFGINRVMRRARKLRGRRPREIPHLDSHPMPFPGLPTAQQRQLFQFGRSVYALPFLSGNRVAPLINGGAAYPDMLAAIGSATTSIALSVYIFERDEVGSQFIQALVQAHGRGVAVRVLIDEIGSSAARSRAADRELTAAGVATARFIPQKLKFLPLINLRNHRKILLVDGRVGYIGGMNICHGYSHGSAEPVRDIHFRVTGPVLAQMNAVFEEDWRFATGRFIQLPATAPAPEGDSQPVYARVIADGPDNVFQRTQWIILGALAVGQKSVRILTPYFLPNDILSHALSVCALRGVDVQVIIPARTDNTVVDWAMAAKLQDLLEQGVKIFAGGAPFDHSKVLVVDGVWSLVGSSNWDQRSLRLNFEANLECYDADLGAALENYFERAKQSAKAVTLNSVKARSVGVRLRNNIARLFAPYL